MSETINFEDFTKVDLRIGTIIDVDDFPKAQNPSFKLTNGGTRKIKIYDKLVFT